MVALSIHFFFFGIQNIDMIEHTIQQCVRVMMSDTLAATNPAPWQQLNAFTQCNLLKIPPIFPIYGMPTFKSKTTPGYFSLESMPAYLCCSTCSYVKQEVLKKQHCARGGIHKWMQTPFTVNAHASIWQRDIAKSLHAYIYRARLIVCEVGKFLKKLCRLSKIVPP